MASKPAEAATEFYARLKLAMDAERRTPTRTEREAGFKGGYLTALKQGKIQTPGPAAIQQFADYLNVQYEWLAIGRGPMRAEDWSPTPVEAATRFARTHGVRADAIASATQRLHDSPMSAVEWVVEFDAEARRLERAGVPRPEEMQRTLAQLTKEKHRLQRELVELEAQEQAARTMKARSTKRGRSA